MKKTVTFFGLISGLLVTTFMVANMAHQQDQVDFKQAEVIGYVSMIVSLSMVFFGIKSYRDNYLHGRISFGKAFQVGLFITLIASALYVTGWMVYSATAGSEIMEKYHAFSIAEVKNSDAPAAEQAEKLKEIEYFREIYQNPFIKAGITFLEIFPVGLVITLLSSLILKRKNHTPSQVAVRV